MHDSNGTKCTNIHADTHCVISRCGYESQGQLQVQQNTARKSTLRTRANLISICHQTCADDGTVLSDLCLKFIFPFLLCVFIQRKRELVQQKLSKGLNYSDQLLLLCVFLVGVSIYVQIERRSQNCEFGATKSVRTQWLPGSHREHHLHLGLACIARCRIWAFVVHRHFSFGSTGPLSIINHMATQIKLKCLLCTLHLFISSCVQHFERLKHEDHFPYLHIGSGAYEAPAPYPVL